jgi:TPP-dependent pyruvate/acetoin dehydrogenase alpha subunit
MTIDLWHLYTLMLRSRTYELAVVRLWQQGLISGEMHLGLGEEAIIAGVVSQLTDGDAMALDHRGTAAMLMRGVDPLALLREMMGQPDGLCHGYGGHMHLFSKEHLAASSGIVGAGGPASVGFALAAIRLRPGTIAVAFFGEGALNQGMLMESFNLAVTWKLPVLFVCKDDSWAITTDTRTTSESHPIQRAQGFGLPVEEADGSQVRSVWEAAERAIQRAREGGGPIFLHATCNHIEGHMMELQLVRLARRPLKEGLKVSMPLIRSLLALKGVPLAQRLEALKETSGMILRSAQDHREQLDDPIQNTRQELAGESERLLALEKSVQEEIESIVARALPAQEVNGGQDEED